MLVSRGARARVVLADSQAEVYVSYYAEGGQEQIFGCAYGERHRYVLGDVFSGSGSGGGGQTPRALAGTTVALEAAGYCNVCSSGPPESFSILAIDLRTGRTLRSAASPAKVQSVVVKQDGALAWVAASDVNVTTGFHQEWVYALDARGERLLAHGNDIAGASLALGDNTVYWTEGGQAHSAALD